MVLVSPTGHHASFRQRELRAEEPDAEIIIITKPGDVYALNGIELVPEDRIEVCGDGDSWHFASSSGWAARDGAFYRWRQLVARRDARR